MEKNDLTLHIDKIYGKISSKKIALELNDEDWYDLVENMYEFFEDDFLINQQSRTHIDVIEATCLIRSALATEEPPNFITIIRKIYFFLLVYAMFYKPEALFITQVKAHRSKAL